ncbi:DUF4124 domain-containing protein [Moritella sp. 5]|nr:DUF4124 domain-containing protein [Moritella sp. 5]
MMLNSISNYKRLILALVCGSMSYSTFAKVYSWRDTDGAMHYSQFPRQIVEKNAAQSRASRKPVEMNDIVNDLSATQNSNLLDGLDDIIANANVERQVEKVLTRRDPQLVLIEQQRLRKQSQQRVLVIAKQAALEKEKALVAVNNIHAITPTQLASTRPKDSTVIENVAVKQHNKFLAEIQNKLKRQYAPQTVQASPSIAPIVVVHAKPKSKPLIKAVELMPAPTYILAPFDATNVFLAGVNKKLNRKDKGLTIDKPVLVASKSESSRDNKRQATLEQVQNKFLAEINQKLFRAKLSSDITPVAELAKSESIIRAKGQGRAAAKNKELTQSADQIKAIESEISSRSHQSNDVKQPSEKQVNSALMLSRLSYNHNARLPLSRAGMSQLVRQGIDVSSQFVSDVNHSAE